MHLIPKYVFRALLVIALTLCPIAKSHADPAPTKSKYLYSFRGGFEYHRLTHKWSILIVVELIKKAPKGGPLYLEATFENPQHGGPALVADSDSTKAEGDMVSLDSPPVTGMLDQQTYGITIRVYTDPAHTFLLGTHKQRMVFHNPGDPEAAARKADFESSYYGKHGTLPLGR